MQGCNPNYINSRMRKCNICKKIVLKQNLKRHTKGVLSHFNLKGINDYFFESGFDQKVLKFTVIIFFRSWEIDSR